MRGLEPVVEMNLSWQDNTRLQSASFAFSCYEVDIWFPSVPDPGDGWIYKGKYTKKERRRWK
jgi:hypothetical protein